MSRDYTHADVFGYAVPDSPKMLRETLCVAQARIGNSPHDEDRKREHMDRPQRLIDECDRKRPLGRGGKHDSLHTDECGCPDRSPRFPTCCAKPRGCTNADAEECPFWNHLWKRQVDSDHPNHIPSGSSSPRGARP